MDDFFYSLFSFPFSVTWLSVTRLGMQLLCWCPSKSLLCILAEGLPFLLLFLILTRQCWEGWKLPAVCGILLDIASIGCSSVGNTASSAHENKLQRP